MLEEGVFLEDWKKSNVPVLKKVKKLWNHRPRVNKGLLRTLDGKNHTNVF